MGPFADLTPVQRRQIRDAHARQKEQDWASSGTTDRGTCPVCGREFNLTKKGLIRNHGAKDDSWPPRPCEGAGQPPKLER